MKKKDAALVLAVFGSTVESGLAGVLGVENALRQAFAHTQISLAFTSNQVRHVWRSRAADPSYVAAHPQLPSSILHIRGPLAAIADLQDQGYERIIVQPGHIVAAEEFHDLAAYVRGLASIQTMKPHWRPFKQIVIGRPALGGYDLEHPYQEDLRAAAEALHEDAKAALDQQAALVYMAHGNRFFPSGGMYLEYVACMRALYPGLNVFIGSVEGFPGFSQVLDQLRGQNLCRVLLKPFLLGAGEHACQDLAGAGPDSWASRLAREGFSVTVILKGLGEQPEFARLFAAHAAEAAASVGIELTA